MRTTSPASHVVRVKLPDRVVADGYRLDIDRRVDFINLDDVRIGDSKDIGVSVDEL
jgi:hypothetical protein